MNGLETSVESLYLHQSCNRKRPKLPWIPSLGDWGLGLDLDIIC